MGLTGNVGFLEELERKMRELASSDWRQELSQNLAEEFRTFVAGYFRASTSPYGSAWEPLRSRESSNGRRQKPLQDSSIMAQSMETKNVTENGFEASVVHPGAKVHQYGATIKAKNAPYLCFPGVSYTQVKAGTPGQHAQRGYSFVRVKEVTIPARPYLPLDGLPPQLEADMIEAADEFIEVTLNG